MSDTRLRLTAAERNLLAERLVSWFGDERQAFLVSQIAPAVERIIAARVTEFQHNAVEMARKADIAEAERDATAIEAERHYAAFVGAESELARLRAAADRVGHQGRCPVFPCDCWVRDLVPLLGDEYQEVPTES